MEKTYKILKLAIVVLAFAVVMAGAWVLYGYLGRSQMADFIVMETTAAPDGETVPETEAPAAPDFTFYDLEGTEHKLSDFRGKPVMLNFWASWCGPCKSEMPEFQTAYETYGEDIHFLIVNLTGGGETVETAKAYIDSQGYTFPVYYDTASSGAMAYGVTAIPATYFLDSEGRIVTGTRGAMTATALQKAIDQLLG